MCALGRNLDQLPMKLPVTLLAMLFMGRLEVPAGDGASVTNFTSPSNYLTAMPVTTNGVNTNTATVLKSRPATNAPSNLPVPSGLTVQKK